MSETIKLSNSSDLRNAASTLREYNSRLRGQVENLVAVEETLGRQWQGEDAQKFHSNFVQDKHYMDEFSAEIDKYAMELETAAERYERRMEENLQILNNKRH